MSDLAAFLAVFILLSQLWSGAGKDDTDSPDGKRSGLTVYTDHKTGCQYLGTILGGITPRLDKEGKPICVEPKP